MTRRRLDLDDPRSLHARLPRMIERTGERIAEEGAIHQLGQLTELRTAVETAIAVAVAGLASGEDPFSWRAIGDELGVSRQEAHRRYAPKAVKRDMTRNTADRAADR